MSLRVRLALWYAGIASIAIAAVVVTAYAVHNQASYLDVDRALAADATHLAAVLEAQRLEGTPHGIPPSLPADARTLVRFYDSRGEPLIGAGAGVPAPPIDATQTLAEDAGPLYDRVFRWLPGGRANVEGSFATARGEQGDRIRLYAVPTAAVGGASGYIQTWTSLEGLDRSMRRFRVLIFGLGLGGVAATWVGSLLVARAALRPVATMTRTARAIAASRGFSRRVPEPARRDELGELARTFNEMLASLEEAYRAQRRFVADAAHELRAPLTAIQGNIELLARVPDMPSGDRAEAMSYLDREAARLARLVNELLTLARADAGQRIERRPVELDEVVLEGVAEMRAVSHGERLAVDAAEPVAVSGDRDRLKQLVLILLDNALRYTPDDGATACAWPGPTATAYSRWRTTAWASRRMICLTSSSGSTGRTRRAATTPVVPGWASRSPSGSSSSTRARSPRRARRGKAP